MNLLEINIQNQDYLESIRNLKKRSEGEFRVNVIASQFVQEDSITKWIKNPTQVQYDEAKELYLHGHYEPAKLLLNHLLENSPEEKVFPEGFENFKVGPAALDMLGRIYLSEKNISSAMDCFENMVDQYFNDEFTGPVDGEGSYGGPAGAQGIVYKLYVLTNSRWFRKMSGLNLTPDYDAAIQLAHRLLKDFDGVWVPCWEDCAYYEEVAASFITTCLEMKNSPLVSWEGEIRKILSSTKNQHLSADLLLTLGKKSIELGNIANAIEIYEEVIDRYSELYIPDDEYSDFRAYSLEAFLSLLDIYKNQGNSEKQLQRVKKEMKNYYENLHQMLATRGDNYSIKQLESDFEKYVH